MHGSLANMMNVDEKLNIQNTDIRPNMKDIRTPAIKSMEKRTTIGESDEIRIDSTTPRRMVAHTTRVGAADGGN